MKVYKFGGASIKNPSSIINMGHMIQAYNEGGLMVVVSAMDKTTNILERLTAAWHAGDHATTEAIFTKVKQFHDDLLSSLLPANTLAFTALSDLTHELRETTASTPPKQYDRAYEMVVPYGELFSSIIVWHYLVSKNININWLDARKLIITDNTWREAKINWDATTSNLQRCYATQLAAGTTMGLLQGFIGGTSDKETTTLGREGSDFTAAIVAYALDAEEVVIWKDVPGLMNADPARFHDAMVLQNISFHEAIELAYYGAKVIHPKTIKPLQNKNIPLRVKSFIDPEAPGSLIHALNAYDQEVPSYIIKEKQTLLSIFPKDFSFIAEKNISEIFSTLSRLNLRSNLMQNSAISFSICLDDHEEKTTLLIEQLSEQFSIRYNKGLELITIRHFTDDIIQSLTEVTNVILEQRSRSTVQLVIKK